MERAAAGGAMSHLSTPARHDAIRGVLGCYGWTLAAASHIVAAGIPLQVNTLVARETEPDLPALAEAVVRLGAARSELVLPDPGRPPRARAADREGDGGDTGLGGAPERPLAVRGSGHLLTGIVCALLHE